MIGTKLAHYEITSHLGSGGMGKVYQATDTKLGRNVAIKFLPEAFSQDSERVARFQREARVLASLNHPNIAAIYGVVPVLMPTQGLRQRESSSFQTCKSPFYLICRRRRPAFRFFGFSCCRHRPRTKQNRVFPMADRPVCCHGRQLSTRP